MKTYSALLASLFCAFSAYAELDLGVRAQSLGGAYRAVANSNDTIFYNPAGLLKNEQVGMQTDYKIATDERVHRVGVSVSDSLTSSWGLGLAYNATLSPRNDVKTSHLLYLASAMPIVRGLFSFGTAFSYSYVDDDENEPYHHFFNMDFGFLLTLPAGVSFALVADHFIAPKGNEKSFGLSSAVAFALGDIVSAIPLTLAFDWLMDDVSSDTDLKHVIGFGVEYLAFNVMPIRLGFKSKIKDGSNLLSMGTGFNSGSFSIDGFYQQNLLVGKMRNFGFALSFQM